MPRSLPVSSPLEASDALRAAALVQVEERDHLGNGQALHVVNAALGQPGPVDLSASGAKLQSAASQTSSTSM
jgi:hypothetical protein